MLTFNRWFFCLAAVAALGAAVVLACGPDFGVEALLSRKQVLLAPPTVSFGIELKALVPAPQDKLPVIEFGGFHGDDIDREKVEAQELSPAVLARVKAMRQQSSGEAARAVGEGLPPALQLYTAGAVSFLHGQTETARAYFQSVLALPAEERRSRELWAHFMLGRMAEQAEAATQFEAVRALARQGMPDPLGLALASLGEQARGAWESGAVANAVHLYAQQASYGSQTGANSLLMVASLILKDKDLLQQGVQDPTTRRLLLICVNGNSGQAFSVGPEADGSADSSIDRLMAAFERLHLTQAEGAGLLASAAYNQGRFDLAQKLSALEDVPMSAWVTAKLALRKGDREAALKAYGKALKGFPAAGSTQIKTEMAVLRLSRGDYVQALDLFYRAVGNGYRNYAYDWYLSNDYIGFADYWGDAAYLAERVLTMEELQDYLDHQLPPVSGSASPEKFKRSRMRNLLARRLMRAGRYREAFRYFDDPKIRDAAEQYSHAVNKATTWWRSERTRAEGWFTAATLARNNGMELLGFEREPDYAMWGGGYSGLDSSDDSQATATNQQKSVEPYQTGDERKRVAASKPERDVRFQYRLTAVDHAMKSADLLPRSSQAFAAVLCEATQWVIYRQPEQAAQIYRRYLHEGAYVPWGDRFGQQCPSPNFAAVSPWNTAARQAKHLSRHARAHPVYSGLLAAMAVTMSTMLIYHGRAWQAGHISANESDIDGMQASTAAEKGRRRFWKKRE